jgi:hypothetical protein
MKKRDEIKLLKHELGRYQKKVGDQSKEIASLTKRWKEALSAMDGAHHAVNLIMARVCQTFGTEVQDEDNGNAHIGYRMSMEMPSEELLAKYKIKTEPKENGMVMIGLVLKEEQHGE